MRNPVRPSSCVTPAGTSNKLDVQNKWEENTQHKTHTGQAESESAKLPPAKGSQNSIETVSGSGMAESVFLRRGSVPREKLTRLEACSLSTTK